MGAYFSIIGIKDISAKNVLVTLKNWENADGDGMVAFQCASGHTVILCDSIPVDAKGLAEGCAKTLQTAVILFTYADDVVWSYELFTATGLEDEFSSRPNYWEESADPARLAGNAHKVCEIWNGVSVEQISRYLSNKSELTEEESDTRAYPDDTSPQWDGWQMCDFMRRLGLEYPVDENGELAIQPEGSVTVATPRGIEQKAQMKHASAQIDEMVEKLKTEGKWPG